MTVSPPSSSKHRRRRLALEPDEAVRVVLEHEQVVLVRELDDLAAALAGERAAARVLEGRDRVDEGRRRVRAQRLLECVEDRGPRRPSPTAHDRRRRLAQDLQRPVVGRRLDEDRLPRPKCSREEHEALQRAVRQHDARRARPRDARRSTRAAACSRRRSRRRGSSCRRARRRRARSRRAPPRRGTRAPGTPRANEIVSMPPSLVAGAAAGAECSATTPGRRRSATSCATSVGVVPTAIPTASSASFFAWAVPDEPEMIAPAWPIVFPGGAEKPAM